MKKQINEIKRMQQLAGLVKESQLREEEQGFDPKKAFSEESYNALNPNAPDWRDYEGYELVLEDNFESADIVDKETFEDEWHNDDMIHNIAMDIAKRAGFKGDLMGLIENNDFNIYCLYLAKKFMIQYGLDMGLIKDTDSIETEYYSDKKESYNDILISTDQELDTLEAKILGNS